MMTTMMSSFSTTNLGTRQKYEGLKLDSGASSNNILSGFDFGTKRGLETETHKNSHKISFHENTNSNPLSSLDQNREAKNHHHHQSSKSGASSSNQHPQLNMNFTQFHKIVTESKKKHAHKSIDENAPHTTKHADVKRFFKERNDVFKENKSPTSFERFCQSRTPVYRPNH